MSLGYLKMSKPFTICHCYIAKIQFVYQYTCDFQYPLCYEPFLMIHMMLFLTHNFWDWQKIACPHVRPAMNMSNFYDKAD